MTEICQVLGKKDKAKDYGTIAAKMKTSIQEGMMRRNLMPDDLMGAYVLAFAFGLVPKDLYNAYKKKLLSLLEKSWQVHWHRISGYSLYPGCAV